MRTLWVCSVAGGPRTTTARRPGRRSWASRKPIEPYASRRPNSTRSPPSWARTLDVVKVPAAEKAEVLGAFAAHKDEVTEGAVAGAPA